ncbi:hypothetical protein [Flavihumibacter profundi]|uniref:hypothetical protein n=1 Tax=Flavihumibacter profundi TaxID=2716883 RepID=UPI001CC7F24F|nr:hypothetical protein [Flavihumibacter profundi]MBZ5857841.1 hypothetical protein [Flavihumibacter profundi]
MTAKSLKTWTVLNFLAFIAVVIVNTLAIVLPINGMDTGKISDLYPNLFVPAGFTFSIWSLIYILLLCFCVYCLKVAFGKNLRPIPFQAIESVQAIFFTSCLLNIGWIFLWHHLQIEWTVIVMLGFLVTLVMGYQRLLPYKNSLGFLEYLCIRLPFSVYLGWISVATIANITALLVHHEWGGFGLAPWAWSCVLIIIATALAMAFLYKWKEVAYSGVIAWALFGIYSKQQATSNQVSQTALTACIAIIIASLWGIYAAYQARERPAARRSNR